MSAPIALVVAVAENGVIGRDGDLPWRLPEDLKRFKKITMGKPLIMGRKTWDSLPRKPLPGRTNIVVTRDVNFVAEGARVAHSIDDAVAMANGENPESIMVIGGAAIFEAALPKASLLYLTHIHAVVEGDVFMPALNTADWRETYREGPLTEGPLRYSFVDMQRA